MFTLKASFYFKNWTLKIYTIIKYYVTFIYVFTVLMYEYRFWMHTIQHPLATLECNIGMKSIGEKIWKLENKIELKRSERSVN